MTDHLQGQLLVASPSLFDSNFRRTVVLIAAHNEDGAMGLVLNRATSLAVVEGAAALGRLTGEEELVHEGGPVQPGTVTALAEWDDPEMSPAIVTGDIGFVPGELDVDEVEPYVRRARVFAGHAGWGPEQLESEIEREDWLLEPASADDIFCEEGVDLWGELLRRKGGEYALLARMPMDPTLN